VSIAIDGSEQTEYLCKFARSGEVAIASISPYHWSKLEGSHPALASDAVMFPRSRRLPGMTGIRAIARAVSLCVCDVATGGELLVGNRQLASASASRALRHAVAPAEGCGRHDRTDDACVRQRQNPGPAGPPSDRAPRTGSFLQLFAEEHNPVRRTAGARRECCASPHRKIRSRAGRNEATSGHDSGRSTASRHRAAHRAQRLGQPSARDCCCRSSARCRSRRGFERVIERRIRGTRIAQPHQVTEGTTNDSCWIDPSVSPSG